MTDVLDERNDTIDREAPDPKIWLYPFLADLGITRIEAFMSGSGDSGDIDDVSYFRGGKAVSNDEVEGVLCKLTVDTGDARPENFKDVLYGIFYKDGSAAGDWYNNEGGSVACSYDLDPSLGQICLIEADYSPGEEYGDEEEDDWEPEPEEADDDVEP